MSNLRSLRSGREERSRICHHYGKEKLPFVMKRKKEEDECGLQIEQGPSRERRQCQRPLLKMAYFL